MPNINYVTKNLAIKIIYYGPGLSGKTTNLRFIYSHLNKDSRGEFLCLETPSERTLFFDLLPVKAGGADGIVFVADSQVPLLDANLENFNGLKKNLLQNNIDINLMPLVFQYNKRDLENLIPVNAFNRLFNSMNAPFVESSALNGKGVFETLSEIAKQVVPRVKEKIFWEKIKTDVNDVMKRKFAVTREQIIIKREKTVTLEQGEDQLQMKKIKFKSQKDVDMEIEKLQKDFLD
jgi:GTPase SAR1 family protein